MKPGYLSESSSTLGMKRWNNGIEEGMFHDCPGDDWELGGLPNPKKGHSKGKKRYTDGHKVALYVPGTEPKGWKLGSPPK